MVTTTKRLSVRTASEADPNCVQRAVREQMERVARVRKVLPVHEGFGNDTMVTVGRGTYVPILRLYTEFQLSEQEAHDSDVLQAMARDAARRLAQAEDLLLLLGHQKKGPLKKLLKKQDVSIDPPKADMNGLLTAVGAVTKVPKKTWRKNAFKRLRGAIDSLADRSYYPPYALLLHPKVQQVLSQGKRKSCKCDRSSTLDQMKRLLESDDNVVMIPRMPKDANLKSGKKGKEKDVQRPGILLPLDDGAIEIIMAERAQFVQTSYAPGNLFSFCVYERIALRIRHPDAIQILSFMS